MLRSASLQVRAAITHQEPKSAATLQQSMRQRQVNHVVLHHNRKKFTALLPNVHCKTPILRIVPRCVRMSYLLCYRTVLRHACQHLQSAKVISVKRCRTARKIRTSARSQVKGEVEQASPIGFGGQASPIGFASLFMISAVRSYSQTGLLCGRRRNLFCFAFVRLMLWNQRWRLLYMMIRFLRAATEYAIFWDISFPSKITH